MKARAVRVSASSTRSLIAGVLLELLEGPVEGPQEMMRRIAEHRVLPHPRRRQRQARAVAHAAQRRDRPPPLALAQSAARSRASPGPAAGRPCRCRPGSAASAHPAPPGSASRHRDPPAPAAAPGSPPCPRAISGKFSARMKSPTISGGPQFFRRRPQCQRRLLIPGARSWQRQHRLAVGRWQRPAPDRAAR